MSKPKRIQRKRTKGWRMPEGCIYVGRPTIFGNPWTEAETLASGMFRPEYVRQICVDNFREWVLGKLEARFPPGHFAIYEKLRSRREKLLERLHELRGRDLACWCRLGDLCHADVLLELCN